MSRSPIQIHRPSPETVELVRRSCESVADRPIELAERFYLYLFDLAPEARPMFPADMTAQTEKLCGALVAAIQALDAPDRIEATLHKLGAHHHRRHAVEPAHYLYVGQSLMHAVRDLAAEWMPSIGSAWVEVFEWLRDTMLAGAAPRVLEPTLPPASFVPGRESTHHWAGEPARVGP